MCLSSVPPQGWKRIQEHREFTAKNKHPLGCSREVVGQGLFPPLHG